MADEDLVQRCRELYVEVDGLSEEVEAVDALASQQLGVAARHLHGARETLERALEDEELAPDGGRPLGVAEGDTAAPWAEHLEIGDVVTFETPAGVLEGEVLGFSAWKQYRGQPVVDWPDEFTPRSPGADLLVLREEDLVEEVED